MKARAERAHPFGVQHSKFNIAAAMIVEETFYRPSEVAHEPRTLPAETYNLAHLLLARAHHNCVFVPIRAMQYLAVIDAEEFIFVDREGRRMIDVAWREFQPQTRASLTDPVPYHAVYYSNTARQIMPRLHGEFRKALAECKSRGDAPVVTARVVKIDRNPA
jgi:hypothetical protein